MPPAPPLAMFTRQRATILLLYLVFFVPYWIVQPATNEYVIARRCLSLHGVFSTSGPVCGGADVSTSGARWYNYLMMACNVPSMLVSLALGRLSDRRGRRPVLLWCCGTPLFGSAGMLAELDSAALEPPRKASSDTEPV